MTLILIIGWLLGAYSGTTLIVLLLFLWLFRLFT
jgi:hypothetical protein